MLTFPCPHCGASLAHVRSLVGNSTKCPHCGEQFVMPETASAPLGLVPTSVQAPAEIHPRPQFAAPPPTIIVAGHREPRLEAGGWFTRAFSTTSGVVLALLLFAALIIGVPIVVVCGGCLLVVKGVGDTVADAAKRAEANRISNSPRPVGAKLDVDEEGTPTEKAKSLVDSWHPFDQPLTVGDIVVRVSAVQRGRVQLIDILDEPRQSESDLLLIRILVENRSEAKMLDFRAWNDPSAFLSRNLATLEDNVGNTYKRVTFPLGTKVEGRESHQSVYPGKTAEAPLVFELPVEAVKVLRLQLAGEAVGAKGNFRFEIPTTVLDPAAFGVTAPTPAPEGKAKETESGTRPAQAPEPSPEREFRTWTSGTFSTEAQFLSMTSGMVKLKKRDGAVVEIAIDKLSEADREYILSGAYKRGE